MKSLARTGRRLKVVLVYTRLYIARFGLVSQPKPRGALTPSVCRTTRVGKVRVAIILLSDGAPSPNFMSYFSVQFAAMAATITTDNLARLLNKVRVRILTDKPLSACPIHLRLSSRDGAIFAGNLGEGLFALPASSFCRATNC